MTSRGLVVTKNKKRNKYRKMKIDLQYVEQLDKSLNTLRTFPDTKTIRGKRRRIFKPRAESE